MHSVTDKQTDDMMMPIVDHTVYQYDRLIKRVCEISWDRYDTGDTIYTAAIKTRRSPGDGTNR